MTASGLIKSPSSMWPFSVSVRNRAQNAWTALLCPARAITRAGSTRHWPKDGC
jgi:hypothetical protein